MDFVTLGRISFSEALRKQNQTVQAVADGKSEETVYLLEHPHVFTIGRRGKEENLIKARGFDGNAIELVRINRGGDITYHGPGQLVVYPHLDLRLRRRDLHAYLRGLEECLIQTAAAFGVKAFQRQGMTGVWTRQGKLASIGVGVRRWITMHGLALNVCPDLRHFSLIHPCGMPACPMTSLSEILGHSIPMDSARKALKSAFYSAFGRSGEHPRSVAGT